MAACTSVQPLDGKMLQSLGCCNVTVLGSAQSAQDKGDIEELCIITGSSFGKFSHPVVTTVQKHKNKACKCGTENAYVREYDIRTVGGWLDTASVTLIGFRYREVSE